MQANQSFWAFYLYNYKICRTFAPRMREIGFKFRLFLYWLFFFFFSNALCLSGLCLRVRKCCYAFS